MFKRAFAFSLLISGLITVPSFAQSMEYDPSGGTPFTEAQINPSGSSTTSGLQFQAQQITGVYVNPTDQYNSSTVNGLPPCSMDSFVYEAGGNAELIYGDEGTTDIPPYFVFDTSHRINAGITGQRAEGLTTGHGSLLPDAWGADEFIGGEPFSMAGSPYPSAPLIIPGLPAPLQTLLNSVVNTSGAGNPYSSEPPPTSSGF